MRRQLNYFSFVRLGKGRQRESTYVNNHVMVIDDILHLKRRSATAARESRDAALKEHLDGCSDKDVVVKPELVESSCSIVSSVHRHKRPRSSRPPIPRTYSPQQETNMISEDEHMDTKSSVGLDLTKTENIADQDMLDGCSALLTLSSRGWEC